MVDVIEWELLYDGFVMCYCMIEYDDGLLLGEGMFFVCSFWLVDSYVLFGWIDDVYWFFSCLFVLLNDFGLFVEEYDLVVGWFVGNFLQVFLYVVFVYIVMNLMYYEDVMVCVVGQFVLVVVIGC